MPNPPQKQSHNAQPKPKKEETTLRTIYLKPNGTNMGHVMTPSWREKAHSDTKSCVLHNNNRWQRQFPHFLAVTLLLEPIPKNSLHVVHRHYLRMLVRVSENNGFPSLGCMFSHIKCMTSSLAFPVDIRQDKQKGGVCLHNQGWRTRNRKDETGQTSDKRLF